MSELPLYHDLVFLKEMATVRQAFHKIPELSWMEFQTTAILCQELESLGYQIKWGDDLYRNKAAHNLPPESEINISYERAREALELNNPYIEKMKGGMTGLVATLKGDEAGQVYGFRFDIDALPIRESNDSCHIPAASGFRSEHDGIMHACGHDAHMAIGVCLARRFAAARKNIKGTVHFFFQPAEEVSSGGVVFAELPELKEVDKFLTLHVGIINKRKIICDATWIAEQMFNVQVTGRASHAGNNPHEGKNALLAACQAVQGLYALPHHSDGMSRVNVGKFTSDNVSNIIADDVSFCFEVRGANDEICEHMAMRSKQVIEGAALMNGCQSVITPQTYVTSQKNSLQLTQEMEQNAQNIGIDKSSLQSHYQVPASEDASFMIRAVLQSGGQATHMILGSPVKGGHHNELFDIDEDTLCWGVDLLNQVVLKS